MRSSRVIVYATEESLALLRTRVDESARPAWRAHIELKSFRRTLQSLDLDAAEPVALDERVSKDWHEGNVSIIFVEESLRLNRRRLEREGVRFRSLSVESIARELRDELHRRRLHWLAHAEHEWRKSGITYLHPKAWRDQFAAIGYDWVGEGLLKQLQVVSDAELRQALQPPEQEHLGFSVAHGYIRDTEPGSSSTNIKDLLEHAYPTPVVEIDLEGNPPETLRGLDVLYIYEDGLWSGVELVRRLQLLARWEPVRDRLLRVIFRYGATCDAGVFAGRHFLRRERLATVDLTPQASLHFELLCPGLTAGLGAAPHASDDEVRHLLDRQVDPLSFRDEAVWGARREEARDVCQEIGAQLVRPWLVRTKGSEGIEERVVTWSLGALRCATLTCFAKSVPKPALPLIWLTGQVTVRGHSMNWRPLFWDARRIGLPHPKLASTS